MKNAVLQQSMSSPPDPLSYGEGEDFERGFAPLLVRPWGEFERGRSPLFV